MKTGGTGAIADKEDAIFSGLSPPTQGQMCDHIGLGVSAHVHCIGNVLSLDLSHSWCYVTLGTLDSGAAGPTGCGLKQAKGL